MLAADRVTVQLAGGLLKEPQRMRKAQRTSAENGACMIFAVRSFSTPAVKLRQC